MNALLFESHGVQPALIVMEMGTGKTLSSWRLIADWLRADDEAPRLVLRGYTGASALLQQMGRAHRAGPRDCDDDETPFARLRRASRTLRQTVAEGGDLRAAVREFLAAVAHFVRSSVEFLTALLTLLLARNIGFVLIDVDDCWRPTPIDSSPQITPRGPNTALPMPTYRGGRRSSALGSALLAA